MIKGFPRGKVTVSSKKDLRALFCEHVRGIFRSVKGFQNNETAVIPIEQSKFTNIDVTSLSCGMGSLGNEDSSAIVFKNDSGVVLRATKVGKNGSEIKSKTTSIRGGENLRFSGAEGDRDLDTAEPSNSTTSKHHEDT